MSGSSQALRRFPLSPEGAAGDAVLPQGAAALSELTAEPRFGIKGPGSSAWIAAQGLPLPPVNRIATHGALRLLRLGGEDFLVLGAADDVEGLTAAWHAAPAPRGYWAFREEGWAWMRLSGPATDAVMARLCAIDLRAGRFGADEIAQTRLSGIEAVLLRAGTGFDVFFDIASTAWFVRTVAAAHSFEGDFQ